ncbi:probable protoporphyrinogen oxidase protein [Candidatus Vecturithrix granuli]|uniref:Probable protoporphyrinogen oxidase protein n=1 Tax=Vecturithrix granuli TaxID=1499967 RepID=A0A081C1G3_VECG1|nr:probable protoporphyrinogen oxidase protein [Candidatus Vecturithrix granuli]
MRVPRIDIIGAGISGLATAYYLARHLNQTEKKGEIHVWEKDGNPGGLAGTFSTQDFTVEKFYHHIFRRDRALQELLSELGLAGEIVWRPAATGAYYFQQPYKLASPIDLLRFKPLPFVDRLRLGWLALHARTIKNWQSLDDISAKEYIHKVAGANVYRVVWQPLFHGKFGSYADEVSAAWLWSKLVDRGGSRNAQGHEVLGYVRGGLGQLFQALVKWLRNSGHYVHLGQAVRCLEGPEERLTSIVTEEGAFAADVIVGCAQLPELADLLPQTVETYRQELRKINFLANVCLVLTLNRSLSDFYWTNVTEGNAPFVGIIEQTNWAEPEDFNRKHVVYLSAYVNPADPRLQMDAQQLLAYYLPSIQKLFPEFTLKYVEHNATWQAAYAQPIVHVGYRHSIPAIASPLANFFVCTMAQIYPHDRQLSNGVALARQTAEIIMQCMFSG